MPGVVDPQLYTRWIQFGAFSPILRTHTTKNPDSERRIWAYPEPYSGIMRSTFQLRYAMIPYIYTEARRTYDTGVAFLRPLYYDWPNTAEAYDSKNEYQFGKNMIVAPVTTAVDAATQLASESIWLPQGEWIESETGRHFIGPIKTERKFSIRQIPIYVPAGAILPSAPPMLYSNQKPLDPLILTVFPQKPGSSSHYTLYEDAGDSRAYRQNQAAWTAITAEQSNGDLVVRVEPEHGSYPGMLHARGYQLRLPGDWPPASITANGKPLLYTTKAGAPGWHYEGNTLTTVIVVPSLPISKLLTVQVHRPMGLIERRAELDGFAGSMTRLREAYDTLNQTHPLAWSPDTLVDVMQTGDRLSYHPETISRELAHFQAVLPQAIATVDKMGSVSALQRAKQNAEQRHNDFGGSSDKVLTRYDSNVALAGALLQDVEIPANAPPDKR